MCGTREAFKTERKRKIDGEVQRKGIRPQHICNLNSVIKSLELATSHKPPSKKTTAPLPISWENLYCFFRFSRREWGNYFLKFILEAAINYGESRARPKTLAGLKGWQDPPKIPNTKQSGDNKHKLCNGKCPKKSAANGRYFNDRRVGAGQSSIFFVKNEEFPPQMIYSQLLHWESN